MLRLAADEIFNGDIVRGLLRRRPNLDIVRIQDVGLSGVDDPAVLEWVAYEGRIVVTHDVSTLAGHAFERVAAGLPMPGVFAVHSEGPIGLTIDDLLLLVECSPGWQVGRAGAIPSVVRLSTRLVGPARCRLLKMADQHYVSKFHFTEFCDLASTGTRDAWLWIGSTADGTVRRRSPKNVATISRLFDGPGELAEPSASLEMFLANEVERPAATGLRRLLRNVSIEHCQSVSDTRRNTLRSHVTQPR